MASLKQNAGLGVGRLNPNFGLGKMSLSLWASASLPANLGGRFADIQLKKNSLKIVPIQYVRQRCLGSAPVTKSGSLTQQKTQLFLIGQFQDRDILWLLLYSSAGVSSPLGSRRNRAQPLGGPSESKQLQSAGVSSVMVTAPSVPVTTFDNSCYFNHL